MTKNYLALILILGLLLSSCERKNQITYTLNLPTAVISAADLSHVIIDFDISATEVLYDVNITLFQDSCQYCCVPDYCITNISPKGNSLHFRDTVDLSSYPVGREFNLSVRTMVEPSKGSGQSPSMFFEDFRFKAN